MIWAVGAEDLPPGSAPTLADYHSRRRGAFSAHLLSFRPPRPTLPGDTRVIDMVVSNLTIPSTTDTTYWCKMFVLDREKDLGGKRHVIKTELAIQRDHFNVSLSEPYVHHMVLLKCRLPADSNWTMSDERPEGQECFTSPNRSKTLQDCIASTPLAVWAVGGEDYYFPEEAGFPLGEDQRDVFLLEMHYDNPTLTEGIVDSSGARLYVTSSLRQYDAGALSFGLSAQKHLFIPPYQESYTVEGGCPKLCTNKALPAEGIQVFSGFLHTHVLGREVTARHIRGEQELEPLFKDKNYDFNYQNMINKKEPVTVLPGDELRVSCKYDSSGKETLTFGGEGTRDEMCLAFVMYYPRYSNPMPACFDLYPKAELLGRALGWDVQRTNAAYHDTFYNTDAVVVQPDSETPWNDMLAEFEWSANREAVRALEEAGLTKPRQFMCLNGAGGLVKDTPWGETHTPLTPLPPPPRPNPCHVMSDQPISGQEEMSGQSEEGREVERLVERLKEKVSQLEKELKTAVLPNTAADHTSSLLALMGAAILVFVCLCIQ